MNGPDRDLHARVPWWRRGRLPWAVLLLCVLVRLPALGLPLEGEGARAASRAARMASGDGTSFPGTEHQGALRAGLLVGPIVGGATPTGAFRWTELLLSVGATALLFAWARRTGLSSGPAAAAALVFAVHPLVLARMGGPVAATDALVTCLALGAYLGVSSPGARGRRAGLLLGALLPLADPVAAFHVPGLAVVYVLREPDRRWRWISAVACVGLFLLGPRLPLTPGSDAPGAVSRLAGLLVGVIGGGLVLLLPALRRGLRAAWRAEAPRARALGRAWWIGTGLMLAVGLIVPGSTAVTLDPDRPGVPALVTAALLLAVFRGMGPAPVPRPLLRLGVGVTALAWLVGMVPLATSWMPAPPVAAGRLAVLGRAFDRAADLAGPEGWVGFALGPKGRDAGLRLGDRSPGRTTGRLTPGRPGALDVEALSSGTALGLVRAADARPPTPGPEVETLGGRGIFALEEEGDVGPWRIAVARRPGTTR